MGDVNMQALDVYYENYRKNEGDTKPWCDGRCLTDNCRACRDVYEMDKEERNYELYKKEVKGSRGKDC